MGLPGRLPRRSSRLRLRMSYTLPNGRQASRGWQAKRRKLLEDRAKCVECAKAAERAVKECDYSPGACQCPEHRS